MQQQEDLEGLLEPFEIGDRELAMASGEELVVQESTDRSAKGNVINLMEALKRSLENVDGKSAGGAVRFGDLFATVRDSNKGCPGNARG